MFYVILILGIFSGLLSSLYSFDNLEETIWWHFLCLGIFLSNILLLKKKANTRHEKRQKVLSFLFILSNTVRSIFPRIDVERICYFDHFLSTTIVGRSFATVGEISLSFQIAFGLLFLMKQQEQSSLLPYILPPAISCAQILCWFGVLTTNQFFHVCEESIWAVAFALMIPLLIQLHRKAKETERKKKLMGCVILALIYVVYMFIVDVPMYYRRFSENNLSQVRYLSLREGIFDAMSCNLVTTKYEVWKEDSIWMIGYFVFGSLVSIGLINE